jgi:hypothetical protein
MVKSSGPLFIVANVCWFIFKENRPTKKVAYFWKIYYRIVLRRSDNVVASTQTAPASIT